MFNKILIVCMGNICRSPLGERLFHEAFPDKQIHSAGIAVENSHLEGHSAESTMQNVASSHQLNLAEHKAKQLTEQHCLDADLILVMEQSQIAAVAQISPSSRGKIMRYGHWTQKDIPDPYKQSTEAFEHVFDLMVEATDKWKSKLK